MVVVKNNMLFGVFLQLHLVCSCNMQRWEGVWCWRKGVAPWGLLSIVVGDTRVSWFCHVLDELQGCGLIFNCAHTMVLASH